MPTQWQFERMADHCNCNGWLHSLISRLSAWRLGCHDAHGVHTAHKTRTCLPGEKDQASEARCPLDLLSHLIALSPVVCMCLSYEQQEHHIHHDNTLSEHWDRYLHNENQVAIKTNLCSTQEWHVVDMKFVPAIAVRTSCWTTPALQRSAMLELPSTPSGTTHPLGRPLAAGTGPRLSRSCARSAPAALISTALAW